MQVASPSHRLGLAGESGHVVEAQSPAGLVQPWLDAKQKTAPHEGFGSVFGMPPTLQKGSEPQQAQSPGQLAPHWHERTSKLEGTPHRATSQMVQSTPCQRAPSRGIDATPHKSTPPSAAVPPIPSWAMGLAPHAASPQGTLWGCCHTHSTSESPLGTTAVPSAATPIGNVQASTPHYFLMSPSAPGKSPGASGGPASLSTPAKLITISTPLRPCSRSRAREMQDDINSAVEEQSVPLLRTALQRRHACPGEHSLHEAVRQAHLPALRLLIHSHAEPNSRCLCLERGCEFPLQLAASGAHFFRASDRYQAVELLLRAGADRDVRRSDGEANTPLHDAVRRGDSDIVDLLLKHRADPNVANGFGETPLCLALRQRGSDFTPLSSVRGIAEALLKAGSSPLALTDFWPLAAVDGDPELGALVCKWAAWWRCRHLAWAWSRSKGHPIAQLVPELLVSVGRFL